MKFNFSIECSGLLRIIHPGPISDNTGNNINKDISVLMTACKKLASKRLAPYMNEKYIENNSLIDMIIKVYGSSFENMIEVANKKSLFTYAFLENIYFLDLTKLLNDQGYLVERSHFNQDGLFGIEYLDDDEPSISFEDEDDEYGIIEDFEDDDEDDDLDDNYYDIHPTETDFRKINQYCYAIYNKASEAEVKEISRMIDTTGDIYGDYIIREHIDDAVLVIPIVSFAIRKAPNFIIKYNSHDKEVKYIVNDNGWNEV